MVLDLGRLALGLICLYFGAEWLVRGAAGLARAFGVKPLVVGLTVVAYGTSAPEFVVSALAALDHKSDIALGNVVGSNIANLGLILGITALISPPVVDGALIRREVPWLVLTAAAVPLVLWDGELTRLEGLLLFAAAVLFTWLTRRTDGKVTDPEFKHEVSHEVSEEAGKGSKPKLGGLALVGLAVLVVGGKIFVDGAVGIAYAFGMSERIVGLTIVAIGTSLPELAASLVAALRGHSALAIGNVIGSNIFNVCLILGGAAALQPIHADFAAMRIDLGALIAFSLIGALFMRGKRELSRVEGAILAVGYGAFLILLIRPPQ